MKNRVPQKLRLMAIPAVALALSLANGLDAQTATAAPQAQNQDQVVTLDPFSVTAQQVGPYQVTEALQGGRIREDLFTSTDSTSIVTQQLIQDTGPVDIFNAVKYLAGIANNSSQTAGDRVSIRGFQVSNPDIDGFDTTQSVVKDDPALYESIEFVRGPDSLLAPNGSPGGTINLVSKVARFDNFGSVTANVGEYNTNSANFDVNNMIGNAIAYRVVVSAIDAPQGENQGYHQSLGVEPSALFKLGPSSQLLLHFTFFNGTAYNYLGIPLDPTSINGTSNIRLLPGINPYETPYADNSEDPSSANHSDRVSYRALFTTNLTDNLSMRINARYLWDWETNNQWNLTGNAGGSVDPYTGQWNAGLNWTGSAANGFTSSPSAPTTDVYSLSQSPTNLLEHYFDVQNDWVYQLKSSAFNSETIVGWAAEAFHVLTVGYSATSAPINVLDIPSATWTVSNKPASDTDTTGNFVQGYVDEKLSFLDGKLNLNGSVVPTWFDEDVTNYLNGVSSTSHPNPTFVNYGADIVPVPWASLYFGHSMDAAQISPPPIPTTTNPNPPILQSGEQDEAGVRVRFLDNRVTASVSYYQLYQTNNALVNPALFSVPPPTVTPPSLYSNRIARGWEYELNATVNKNLSVVGSFTNYTNRSPYDVPFRGDPETAGAIYANYHFVDGQLDGLSFGAGFVYQGKAAGNSVSGLASGSTATDLIPNQPYYYIPAYGLLNLTASYRLDKHWTVRFFLDNALNKFYYAGTLNANAVMPGIPINPHGSITYSF